MKIYTKKFTQFIPTSMENTWEFFSSPLNLSTLSPASMNFVITSDFNAQTAMYPGMLISYTVSPLFSIPLSWTTEITQIKKMDYFIDQQRFGPFALWHHEHHFSEVDRGTLMVDILHYAIGWGIIGTLANELMVAKKAQSIFEYRSNKIIEIFG